MKRFVLLFFALLLLSGCAAPAHDAAASTAPPSTLEAPPRDAVVSVVEQHVRNGTESDDQLVLYAESIALPSEEDDPGYVSVRDIYVEGSVLMMHFDACGGMAKCVRDVSDPDGIRKALRVFVSEYSAVLGDACDDMGRQELDGVVFLMSDEDPDVPLMFAVNGRILYDAGVDDPADAVFDPARYSNAASEPVDIMAELKAAYDRNAPRGASLYDIVFLVGAYRYEVMPASGTAFLLSHRRDDSWAALGDAADTLCRLTAEAQDTLAQHGEETATYAVVINDQDPSRALLAVYGGEIVYDCREDLPDAAPAMESTGIHILNTSTRKIHNPWCAEVKKIDDRNREVSSKDLHALLLADYTKCEKDGDWDLTTPTYPESASVGRSLDELTEEGVVR